MSAKYARANLCIGRRGQTGAQPFSAALMSLTQTQKTSRARQRTLKL